MADEQTEITAERPEGLPEQFQSVEALAQAYEESRREMSRSQTQAQQQQEQFTSAIESLQAQQQQPPQQPYYPAQQQFDPVVSAYSQAYETGDVQGMLAAQAQYNLNATIPAVAELLKTELGSLTPDIAAARQAQREHDLRLAEGLVERQLGPERYRELVPKIRELADDNQGFLPQASSVEGYAASILNIAKIVEHDQLQKRIADLEAEQAEKRSAQTLTGGYAPAARDLDADRAEFERIKNTQTGSFAELLAKQRG